jgi:tetratricopeptide (TPR) repeat protein
MSNRKVMLTGLFLLSVAAVPTALAQSTGAAELRLNRGIERFMAEDYDAARAQFTAALQYDSSFAPAHYLLGLTYLQLAAEAEGAEQGALLDQALESFERSRTEDPELVTAYLDAALAQAILRRFEEAESALQRFLEARPDEPLPYLFLAIVYYREARDNPARLDDAAANLERAEAALAAQPEPDPSIEAYVKFYQGLVLLDRRDREAARAALQESAAVAPDSVTAQRSEELLRQIEEGRVARRRPWELNIRLGYAYDTNVILRGEGIPIDRGPYSDEADSRFGVGTTFDYNFIDSNEVVLGAGFNTFHTWHCDIHDFNVQTYGGNVYLGYAPQDVEWLSMALRYDYDFSLVGNDPFLSRHRITPQVTVQPVDWTRSTVFYQFDHRDYQEPLEDEAFNRDGDTHAFGLSQDFELFEMFGRPFEANLSYRYENSSTVGTEFAAQYNIFGVGFKMPLPYDFAFDFRTEFEKNAYKNRSVFSAQRDARNDEVTNLIFGLTKRFNENASLRFQVDWTQADSDIHDRYGREPYSYDRIIYGVALMLTF